MVDYFNNFSDISIFLGLLTVIFHNNLSGVSR